MRGLHVLAALPPFKKDRTKYLVRFLEGGKERWDWRVSVLCDGIERRAFQGLTASAGEAIARPHLLREADWERDPAEMKSTEERMREAERAAGMTTGQVILAGAHNVGRGFNLSVRHIRKYALVRRVVRDNTEAFRF